MHNKSLVNNLLSKFFPQYDFHPFQNILKDIGPIIEDNDISVSLLKNANNSIGPYESKSSRNKQLSDLTHNN